MRADHIEYVLQKLGADDWYQRGNNIQTNCVMAPWNHSSGYDSKKRMGVLVQQGPAIVNCFRGGCFSGTLLELVMTLEPKLIADGKSTWDEMQELKSFIILTEDEEVEPSFQQAARRPVGEIPKVVVEALGKGSPYFRSRGVSPEGEQLWKLGEAGGRALIPIIDRKGEVVGVQARLLPGNKLDDFPFDRHTKDDVRGAKYRTWPAGLEKEAHLVGAHLAKGTVDFLLVVEGMADPMVLYEWLNHLDAHKILPYSSATEGALAVSTMGSKASPAQVQAIVDLVAPKGEVCIGYDGDEPGLVGASRLVDGLRRRIHNLTEVSWVRSDPTDSDGGKLDMDTVRRDFYTALGRREHWLERKMKKVLQAS